MSAKIAEGRIMPMNPEEMKAKIIANLPQKTGHSLEEWIDPLGAQGPRKERTGSPG